MWWGAGSWDDDDDDTVIFQRYWVMACGCGLWEAWAGGREGWDGWMDRLMEMVRPALVSSELAASSAWGAEADDSAGHDGHT